MTARSKVRNIALSQLVLSPTNVRKTPATAAEDMALEASIRAQGHPAEPDRPSDADRRQKRLRGRCRRPPAQDPAEARRRRRRSTPIIRSPAKSKAPTTRVETSLVENTIRAAMHPADEFVAMAALIDGGMTIDDVAKRFGTSERHVRQRLRLGKLAPELLDAYRAGDISLDAVTAFTLGADHAAQLAVWNQLKDNSYIQPYTVKRLLTESAVPLDSDLGMFVGAEAYEAAGGTITRDLFSGDDDGFMDDAALVRRLAIEKLEAKAAELRPQWAWTKAVLDPEYGFMAQYARLRPQPAEVPAELAAEIERIEQRLGELEEIGEDDWTDELAAEAAQLEERRTEIDETIDGLAVYSDKDRARAGCIVTIGDDGEFCLHQGLVERTAVRGGVDDRPMPTNRPMMTATSRSPRSRDDEDDDLQLPPVLDRRRAGAAQGMRLQPVAGRRSQGAPAADHPRASGGGISRSRSISRSIRCAPICSIDFRYHSHPLDLRATEAAPRSSLNDLSGTPADQLIEVHGHRARSRLARNCRRPKALPRSRHCRPTPSSGCSPGASRPDLKPQLAIEDRADPVIESAGRRLAHPVRRLLAADRRQLLGPREEGARPRDRPGNPRRSLGARSRRRQKAGARGGARNRLRSGEKQRLHRSRPGGARQRCRRGCRPAWPMATTRLRRIRSPTTAADIDDRRQRRDRCRRRSTSRRPICRPS